MVIAFCPLSGAFQHTDATSQFAQDFVELLARHGFNIDTAARTMGISPSQLSAQLVGRKGEQLSAYRIHLLGPDFVDDLYTRRLERRGFHVARPGVLAEMIQDYRNTIAYLKGLIQSTSSQSKGVA